VTVTVVVPVLPRCLPSPPYAAVTEYVPTVSVFIDRVQLDEEPLQEIVQEPDALTGPVDVTVTVPDGLVVTFPVLLTVKVQLELPT